MTKNRSSLLAASAFLVVLALVVTALAPGVNATFFYDDTPILQLLPNVAAGRMPVADFMNFGFYTGPLGRPLSMATFLWPVTAYPKHPEAIFAINIALHAANTLLVGLLAWRIGQILNSPHALWLGVFTAALWGLAPIQAATVLVAVQRMASLSAFFTWLGLLLWIIGLQRSLQYPSQGRALQIIGLIGMTGLALLSKENGALLPLFAGVIEATLLSNLMLPYRRVRGLLYFSSLMVLLSYLVYSLWSSGGVYWERAFNVWERVMTEAVILFEYLRQSFAPRFLDIHPLHDAYPVIHSFSEHPEAAAALLFWVIVIPLAWFYRKRSRVLSFAVLWFLTAHLLESSVLALDLYYEHRQYIAWFGFAFALVWGALHVSIRFQKLARFGLGAFILLLGFLMYQTAALWGRPVHAAEIWFERNPGSTRAAEHLALIYTQLDLHERAYATLDRQVTNCPNCLASIAQAIQLSCLLGKQSDVSRHLTEYFKQVLIAPVTGGTAGTLSQLQNLVKKKRCTLVDWDTLERMNNSLLDRALPMYNLKRQQVLNNLHLLAIEKGNMEASVQLLLATYTAAPRAELGLSTVQYLLQQNQRDKALRFVSDHLCAPQPMSALFSHAEWNKACVRAQSLLDNQ
jgi:hypothetical protein